MSNSTPRLILASSSPQRKQLMSQAGYQFEVILPDESAEDCGVCSTGGPAALVADLAMRKAANVVAKMTDKNQTVEPSLIVACDTVAECAGTILGKPRDEDHAFEMLTMLRGQEQRVLSGLCLWPLALSESEVTPQTYLAITELRMDPIPEEEIEEYLASGLWRGKAGAFGYQDRHGWLHILHGSESNVIGLPMEMLSEQLERLEFSVN